LSHTPGVEPPDDAPAASEEAPRADERADEPLDEAR
jgi:hypothetical protein